MNRRTMCRVLTVMPITFAVAAAGSGRAADQGRARDQLQDSETLGITIPQSLLLRADAVIQ